MFITVDSELGKVAQFKESCGAQPLRTAAKVTFRTQTMPPSSLLYPWEPSSSAEGGASSLKGAFGEEQKRGEKKGEEYQSDFLFFGITSSL